jgi:hypothetical protein
MSESIPENGRLHKIEKQRIFLDQFSKGLDVTHGLSTDEMMELETRKMVKHT